MEAFNICVFKVNSVIVVFDNVEYISEVFNMTVAFVGNVIFVKVSDSFEKLSDIVDDNVFVNVWDMLKDADDVVGEIKFVKLSELTDVSFTTVLMTLDV